MGFGNGLGVIPFGDVEKFREILSERKTSRVDISWLSGFGFNYREYYPYGDKGRFPDLCQVMEGVIDGNKIEVITCDLFSSLSINDNSDICCGKEKSDIVYGVIKSQSKEDLIALISHYQ